MNGDQGVLVEAEAYLLAKFSKTSSHLLIYHMLDTAAVSLALWNEVLPSEIKNHLINQINGSGEPVILLEKLFAFITGIHDLGKITPSFQIMVYKFLEEHNTLSIANKKLFEQYRRFKEKYRLPDMIPKRYHHGLLSYITIIQNAAEFFPETNNPSNKMALKPLAQILGAHHGKFHSQRKLGHIRRRNATGDENWTALQARFIQIVAKVIGCEENLIIVPKIFQGEDSIPLGTFFAGFVCVADWIASNENFFPHQMEYEDFNSLIRYWEQTQEIASDVLQRLHWIIPRQGEMVSEFQGLFPFDPRPLQEQVIQLSIHAAECYIIEAPTGVGKSEAAMYVATQNELLGLRGSYFALPTQATSNQMFGRVKTYVMSMLQNSTEAFNIMLLHGHSMLHEDFARLPKFVPKDIYDETQEIVPIAAEWFTFRKRGLLSPYGVGTIDQALLSILRTPHFFLRLFGLTGKTLILDEVHAYDTYMTQLIERLLEWIGALGSSVVLLSATLPKSRQKRLSEAYSRGRAVFQPNISRVEEPVIDQTPYPRLSWTTQSEILQQSVETSSVGQKELQIEHLSSSGDGSKLREYLKTQLAEGGCAALICNTVREAQEYREDLTSLAQEEGVRVILFHARYRFMDRNRTEREILSLFGKYEGDDPKPRPKKAIVISTQIIEQSLDIDFDLMVTAVAPIDLLLQRAGRLHRHQRTNDNSRPNKLKNPKLILFEPSFKKGTKIPNFSRYAMIYHPHILLRTWLLLQCYESITIPGDVETMIETVYQDTEKIPEQLNHRITDEIQTYWDVSWKDLQKKQEIYREIAKNNIIPSPGSLEDFFEMSEAELEEENPQIHESHQALTRLISPTINLVLILKKEKDHARKILNKNRTQGLTTPSAKWFLDRSVHLSTHSIVNHFQNIDPPSRFSRTAVLKFHRIVYLDDRNEYQFESEGKVAPKRLQLDPILGVKLIRN